MMTDSGSSQSVNVQISTQVHTDMIAFPSLTLQAESCHLASPNDSYI